jgi:hypothetical protein
MHSQLTTIVAGQQQADRLAAAERSRRAAVTTQRTERPRRVWRVLRRRAAVA